MLLTLCTVFSSFQTFSFPPTPSSLSPSSFSVRTVHRVGGSEYHTSIAPAFTPDCTFSATRTPSAIALSLATVRVPATYLQALHIVVEHFIYALWRRESTARRKSPCAQSNLTSRDCECAKSLSQSRSWTLFTLSRRFQGDIFVADLTTVQQMTRNATHTQNTATRPYLPYQMLVSSETAQINIML